MEDIKVEAKMICKKTHLRVKLEPSTEERMAALESAVLEIALGG